MTDGFTRADFLRAGLATLATGAAAPLFASTGTPRPVRHKGPPSQPSLLDLVFEPIHQFRAFDLLPREFLQVEERFEGTALSPSLEALSKGAPARLTLQNGRLSIVSSQAEPTLVRLTAGLVAPFGSVIVKAPPTEGSPPDGGATLFAGLVRDVDNYVIAAFEKEPDPGSNAVSIDVCVEGRRTRVATIGANLTNATEFAFAVNENYVTALIADGSKWIPVVQHHIANLLDLRNPTVLQRYRFGFGSGGIDRNFTVESVRAGYFGQVGIRDLHVVSYDDGRPYIRGRKLYFTATQAGLSFFQAAHWGVWTLDLDQPNSIEPVATLFFARDGLVLGDHAGHIVVDERSGGFHVAVSSWGDFAFNGVHVRYCRTFEDILSGVHVLKSTRMPLPTPVSAWDPSMVRIDERWYVGFVESSIQDPGNFVFWPALARGRSGGPITQLTRVGADRTRRQTEGTILQKVGGRWYLLASDGANRKYRAYDLSMRLVGFLRAPYGSNLPHPQVIPIPENDRTAYLLITFDGTPYHDEVLDYGTHGDVIIMRAMQTRYGHEIERADAPHR